MQDSDRISLNALRIFVVAAERGSLKLTANRLGVTPGAVSHQIRRLEEATGKTLFDRANNSIRLTEIGEFLFRQAQPAIQSLEHAIEATVSAAPEISVQAPITFATRWLIPRLEAFRADNPDVRIRIETTSGTGLPPGPGADVTLAYHPLGAMPEGANVFLEDRCRPYLSPDLLAKTADVRDLEAIPALQCAVGNWDWELWLKGSGNTATQLKYAGHFDLDDAALRAAIAGMGMVLAPEFIIRDDLKSRRLCALPEAGEVVLGAYTLHHNGPASRHIDRFMRWLRKCTT